MTYVGVCNPTSFFHADFNGEDDKVMLGGAAQRRCPTADLSDRRK